jgi:hypothetical protein
MRKYYLNVIVDINKYSKSEQSPECYVGLTKFILADRYACFLNRDTPVILRILSFM